MADTVRRVEYFYVQVADRPGEGARALATLQAAGVNLLAFSGFPQGRKAQLDFVPEEPGALRRLAKKAGWKLTGPKRAFLIQGEDRVGAVAEVVRQLSDANINVVALTGVCAGAGRYGVILWVDPQSFVRAGKLLGVD
jgi:hypothetical protein